MTDRMTKDELRQKCIEAIADRLYRLEYGTRDGLGAEKEWAIGQGLEWPTYTIEKFYDQAAAAFDALHGLARVVPIEATQEILISIIDDDYMPGAHYRSMTAAGDLTKPR